MILTTRLLAFARELQHATTFRELLEIARREALEATGYSQAWLFVSDTEDALEWRLVEVGGSVRDQAWAVAPILRIAEDPMLLEVATHDRPVVVVDARTDPRTDKRIVEDLGNRTIINVPLRLLDKPFGAFGVGTFGDEGCRPPTDAELGHLVGMAGQLAIAGSRLRLIEERKRSESERLELERRLYRFQKLESLGQLAGGVAHDFNNLLTIILSGATLAQEHVTGAGLADLAAVIAAAERGQALTRQLLAMSRTQALKLSTVDLNVCLRDLVALARRILPATVELDLIPGVRLPLVEIDVSQIDQVFMNLVINARDAMPTGGRLVIATEQVVVNGPYVREHPWAKAGRYVLATVTDTGAGMPPEVLERIFEPFFTTKGDAGSGLGLATTYGIVLQHGGLIHAYSEVGIGTAFKVYLPAHERRATEVGTTLESRVRGGAERILLAEDDPALGRMAERVLSRAGYQVTVVRDGLAACREVESAAYDLVVLDVVMPGMGGIEALRRIRASAPGTRFLLSSGYSAGSGGETVEGIERIDKPYDPDGLLRAVRRVLDRR